MDELAREAALSRSALAERFTALVGEPPIQYLMRWRLALAAQALRSGADAIAQLAERSRLRVRGGVQPRVQARVRHAARGLAQGGRQFRFLAAQPRVQPRQVTVEQEDIRGAAAEVDEPEKPQRRAVDQ